MKKKNKQKNKKGSVGDFLSLPLFFISIFNDINDN